MTESRSDHTEQALDLLLEVGTEEIPARFMPGLLAQLEEKGAALLGELRLDYADLAALGTPRRFALMVRALATSQPDQTVESRGPAVSIAFDASGQPTRAAEGFARGQGLGVGQLERRNVGGTEYVFAVRHEAGRGAAELLATALPRLITSLEFPKSMRWGDRALRFVRPIRWLVAIHGDRVIPFTIEGIKSGSESRGHRTLSDGPVTIGTAAGYVEGLRQARVIADQNERRALVVTGVREAAREHDAKAVIDDDLLEEVVYMVEHPTAFVGRFAREYLEVPAQVVTTTMKVHQRYFPVTDDAGRLQPLFVGVRDGDLGGIETVQAGNEKVLRARLADARFFWDEDLARPLPERVATLKTIVFQEKLGTLHDKTERIRALSAVICQALKLDADTARAADRAAALAKADLGTALVREFPELQGEMGREYALRSGEVEAVATAIAEHYLPRGAGDQPAATPAGRVVAIADKLDTLAGCFAAGLVPTGSADPYGLRRATIGLLSTLFTGGYRVSLTELILAALGQLAGRLEMDAPAVTKALGDFIRGRLRVMLADRGFRHDTIEAVLSAGADDPVDASHRCQQLEQLRLLPAFGDALAAYGRVASLATKATTAAFDPAALSEPEERQLVAALADTGTAVEAHRQTGDYLLAWQDLAMLRPTIDEFLNGTMVMADDPSLRANRLGLVRTIADLFASDVDFGQVVAGDPA